MGIEDEIMGDVWPEALPGRADADYGSVVLIGEKECQVRSFQTFKFVYTVGEYGLDDTGAIKIVHRWTSDGGPLQTDDPSAINYVTATASSDVKLAVYAEPYPHQRPWYSGLRVTVERGYMKPGDTITVVYGDRSTGSPGFRLQTFCESAHEFNLLVDPCATAVFVPVASPSIAIVAGEPEKWVLTAPTLRRPGEKFSLGIRAEDIWGNATDRFQGNLKLKAKGTDVAGLPDEIVFSGNARGVEVPDLSIAEETETRFELLDGDGNLLARSNPLIVRQGETSGYWGDLHGQSGETVGINPLREYLEFARDIAFLDVTSHQANDFQITDAFWNQINTLSAEFNEDGKFVVFPGYEWSGNTPVGGDHNVFFLHENRQIHRSSRALLTDRSDLETDAPTLNRLFENLEGEDCVLYAHIGGRPADISFAENAKLRTAVEVHSDWGTFEWIMTDAFKLGYRAGLVCNSDGHKGAPGACHPGASEFGAYSGLTCFLTDELTRDGIFRAMRQRRHYGTTGCRMHMDVTARFSQPAEIFLTDPRLGDTTSRSGFEAKMGDIVKVADDHVNLEVGVHTHAPIERIDVLKGGDTITSLRPFEDFGTGYRFRVIWQGAEYRGRGRQTRWNGTLRFDKAKIRRMEKINAWNHERPFFQENSQTIVFDAVTTGNFGGCDIWLEDGDKGQIEIETPFGNISADLAQLGQEEKIFDFGGLDRKVRLFRLPEKLETCQMTETAPVPVSKKGDSPVWIRVATEDGFLGWSSPIYLFR